VVQWATGTIGARALRGVLEHPGLERITHACELGNSSIHATGSSPGFITEALPLMLSSIQRCIDGLTIDEYADLSQRDSPTCCSASWVSAAHSPRPTGHPHHPRPTSPSGPPHLNRSGSSILRRWRKPGNSLSSALHPSRDSQWADRMIIRTTN
jgi:hypothetical protein